MAYEQFSYQESIFEELTRAWALFNDGPSLQVPPVAVRNWNEILGGDLRTLIGVGFLLSVSAMVNGGYFDVAWIDRPDMEELTNEIDLDTIRHVGDVAFTTTFDQFRIDAAQPPPHPFLPQYAYNPLTGTPFVHMAGGAILAPQPSLILRRVTPGGLYYPAAAAWRGDFTDELGHIFEAYVGRQLKTIPNARVLPAISYATGSDVVDSIDWFLIFDEIVVLVEAKSTRLPIDGRVGSESLQSNSIGRSASHSVR